LWDRTKERARKIVSVLLTEKQHTALVAEANLMRDAPAFFFITFVPTRLDRNPTRTHGRRFLIDEDQ